MSADDGDLRTTGLVTGSQGQFKAGDRVRFLEGAPSLRTRVGTVVGMVEHRAEGLNGSMDLVEVEVVQTLLVPPDWLKLAGKGAG